MPDYRIIVGFFVVAAMLLTFLTTLEPIIHPQRFFEREELQQEPDLELQKTRFKLQPLHLKLAWSLIGSLLVGICVVFVAFLIRIAFVLLHR